MTDHHDLPSYPPVIIPEEPDTQPTQQTINQTTKTPGASLISILARGTTQKFLYGGETRIAGDMLTWSKLGSKLVLHVFWCLGGLYGINSIRDIQINGLPTLLNEGRNGFGPGTVEVVNFLGTPNQTVDVFMQNGKATQGIDYQDDNVMVIEKNGVVYRMGQAYSSIIFDLGTYDPFPQNITALVEGVLIPHEDTQIPFYTNSPSYFAFDLITNPLYGYDMFVDVQSLKDCVTNNARLVGETGNQISHMECALLFSQNTSRDQLLNLFRIYAQCFYYQDGRTVYMVPDQIETPGTLIDDDMMEEGSFVSSGRTDERTPTVIRFTYTNADDGFAQDTDLVILNEVKQGKLPWIESSINLDGVTSLTRARFLAIRRLNRFRLESVDVTFMGPADLYELVPGDVRPIKNDVLGFPETLMRITKVDKVEPDFHKISARKYDILSYDDTIVTINNNPPTVFPDLFDIPNVSNFNVTEVQIPSGEVYKSRLFCTWDLIDLNSVLEYEIQILIDEKVEFSVKLFSDNHTIDIIESGVHHSVRIRARSSMTASKNWTVFDITPEGELVSPSPPIDLVVVEIGNETRADWDEPEFNTQIVYYQVFYGPVDDFANSIFLGTTYSTFFKTTDIPPGTWEVWVRAVNQGNRLKSALGSDVVTVNLETRTSYEFRHRFVNQTLINADSFPAKEFGRPRFSERRIYSNFPNHPQIDISFNTLFSGPVNNQTDPMFDVLLNRANNWTSERDFAVDASWTKGTNWTVDETQQKGISTGSNLGQYINIPVLIDILEGEYYTVEIDCSNYQTGIASIVIYEPSDPDGGFLVGEINSTGNKFFDFQIPVSTFTDPTNTRIGIRSGRISPNELPFNGVFDYLRFAFQRSKYITDSFDLGFSAKANWNIKNLYPNNLPIGYNSGTADIYLELSEDNVTWSRTKVEFPNKTQIYGVARYARICVIVSGIVVNMSAFSHNFVMNVSVNEVEETGQSVSLTTVHGLDILKTNHTSDITGSFKLPYLTDLQNRNPLDNDRTYSFVVWPSSGCDTGAAEPFNFIYKEGLKADPKYAVGIYIHENVLYAYFWNNNAYFNSFDGSIVYYEGIEIGKRYQITVTLGLGTDAKIKLYVNGRYVMEDYLDLVNNVTNDVNVGSTEQTSIGGSAISAIGGEFHMWKDHSLSIEDNALILDSTPGKMDELDFDGRIGNVSIYTDRLLTDQEIFDLYKSNGIPTDTTDLLIYYDMSNNGVDTLNDQSGNNHDATAFDHSTVGDAILGTHFDFVQMYNPVIIETDKNFTAVENVTIQPKELPGPHSGLVENITPADDIGNATFNAYVFNNTTGDQIVSQFDWRVKGAESK